ncbi:hypothetical protein [Halomonas litopenaei]|uniref:hypothetical protein n=1 Tax=Halomonas litopenaei TaxID=2109328 RepID=UPI001A8CC6D1|nr:hypothetical protein [Halomonas litopenaei]MBN8413595.1 hypothetical protein [Halomonas litopenaei]
MLTFSTIFPIAEGATVDQVDSLMRTWLVGSQHSAFDKSLLDEGNGESQWSLNLGRERVAGIKVSDSGSSYLGLRYEKDEDDGVTWTTEVTYHGAESLRRVAVKVHCESETTALKLPPARKPYIVRQFISELGGGLDGWQKVSDEPLCLGNSDIELAADLINGACRNELPIVYLSSSTSRGVSVRPESLAHRLSGIAHVVTEPNREFSFRLMHEVGHRNAYGGAIGIYWPDLSDRELLLPREFDYDPRSLGGEISRIIRNRAIRLRTPRDLTWAFQRELIARQQIERLRKDGAADLTEYVESFDEELKAKEEALDRAEAEIRRLTAEVHGLRTRGKAVSGVPVLARGSELDLYENETVELLNDVLAKALGDAQDNSRRQHLLQSLVAAIEPSSNRDELIARIKAALSQYRKLDSAMSHELEELGFDIEADGKHYKMTFRGDQRYTITMPKTSSDHRAGKNLVSQIKGVLF